MSIWKKLFGGGEAGTSDQATAKPTQTIEHNGFTIHATPYKDGGQYQLCGVIEKTVDGELRSHRFIRADRFAGLDEATEFTLVKGRQLAELEGEKLLR